MLLETQQWDSFSTNKREAAKTFHFYTPQLGVNLTTLGAYIVYIKRNFSRYQAGPFDIFYIYHNKFFLLNLNCRTQCPMYQCMHVLPFTEIKYLYVFPPNYIFNVHGSPILAYQLSYELSNTVFLTFEKKQFSNIQISFIQQETKKEENILN